MKLLLVDDDIFLRDMYETKFSAAGHEVQAVKNSAEALAAMNDQDFDILLTDLVIPEESGLVLLEKLQAEQKAFGEMVKIVLTNQSEASDKEAAEAAGADGYLVKASLTPSEVVEAVEDIYKQKQK